ncbi:hypothetical protein BX600DRAFT_57790 [Xylariales sp. PMI_506]|nr:hypothetical protein BX600DRAFT_57790 [Xylariales sp. PMI_506]
MVHVSHMNYQPVFTLAPRLPCDVDMLHSIAWVGNTPTTSPSCVLEAVYSICPVFETFALACMFLWILEGAIVSDAAVCLDVLATLLPWQVDPPVEGPVAKTGLGKGSAYFSLFAVGQRADNFQLYYIVWLDTFNKRTPYYCCGLAVDHDDFLMYELLSLAAQSWSGLNGTTFN